MGCVVPDTSLMIDGKYGRRDYLIQIMSIKGTDIGLFNDLIFALGCITVLMLNMCAHGCI